MKTMLITGASSGIGEATAKRAVEAGYRVGLAARRKEKLDGLVRELGPDNALAFGCDVTDFASQQAAVAAVRGRCEIAVITRSELGSLVVTADEVHEVPAAPVTRVVDTTGAGDLFAAGFLFGLTRGRPLPECARIGAIAAAEVISHYGARPEVRLAGLLG